MKHGLSFWCFALLLLCSHQVASETLESKMKADADISQFWALLEQCRLCNLTLEYEQLTVFAPINAAFQKLGNKKEDTDSLVQYHLINIPKKTDQFGGSSTSINSKLAGSPPLWITHTSGHVHNDIYINNAKVLISQSNVIGQKSGSGGTITQILHKIDEVLIPTRSPTSELNQVFNPTAWEFLENYGVLIQGPHRVRNFRQRVEEMNKADIFKTEGGHTFFIPVDEGFEKHRAGLIDDKIIDGHVIPKQVLFTTPTKKDFPFQTLANVDNVVRVVITFTQERRAGDNIINYVKSHTLVGDGVHTPGVVLAEIVKANIPVKNGVIHLIQKPLMIVDSNVKELLEENDGGILNSFFNAINDASAQDFLRTLEKYHDVTLFAPCNAAFGTGPYLNSIMSDRQRFMEILYMHLVIDKRLYVDTVATQHVNQSRTLNKRKNLYFNVFSIGNNKTMTVEGGGVNATVIQPDLAAKNGVIHIIDRVLGIPMGTVLDKLNTDPMLSKTRYLGNIGGFNERLNSTDRKFTYFVPRNRAWSDATVALPSVIKKLFMRDYAYHATTTLERHLVISDSPYTMERIKQLTNETNSYTGQRYNSVVELPTVRGSLKILVEERDNTFNIIWNGRKIPVFRPNVECINGIIHVIDYPFLKEGDVIVSGSPRQAALTWSSFVIIFVALFSL